MSNGAHTYEAVRTSLIKVLTEDFHPDWETLVGDAFAAFIEDVRDDARVDLDCPEFDEETEELRPGAEFEVRIFLNDESLETISKPQPLSALLIKAMRDCGPEDTLQLLSNTLAVLHAHIEKELDE